MTRLLKNQIVKEILISFAFILAYRLLLMVSIPFINLSEFNTSPDSMYGFIFGEHFLDRFSIAALGIMPYVSAYIFIEICSLFIPFLKRYRGGDYYGRKVLHRYALILTLCIGVIQATFIIQGLQGLLSPSGKPILVLSNNSQFLFLLFTLVATVFILLLMAEIVTKHGIGNGISLLICSGACFSTVENIFLFISRTRTIQLNFFHESLFLIIMIVLLIVTPIFLLKITSTIPLKHDSDEYVSKYFNINSCLSGKVAMGYTTYVITLPIIFMSFTGGFKSLPLLSDPDSFWYNAISCILVVLLSYTFGWIFLHPRKRFSTLHEWGWKTTKPLESSIQSIKPTFLLLHLPWALFLCGLIILPSVIIKHLDFPFIHKGSSLLIIAFLSLDYISRFRLWGANIHEKTFKIAEFQDVHHATMIKNHLKDAGVKFYLQGYYHRHLLYFFGPYIPISLMVPAFEKKRVWQLIDRYYGGLGLLNTNN